MYEKSKLLVRSGIVLISFAIALFSKLLLPASIANIGVVLAALINFINLATAAYIFDDAASSDEALAFLIPGVPAFFIAEFFAACFIPEVGLGLPYLDGVIGALCACSAVNVWNTQVRWKLATLGIPLLCLANAGFGYHVLPSPVKEIYIGLCAVVNLAGIIGLPLTREPGDLPARTIFGLCFKAFFIAGLFGAIYLSWTLTAIYTLVAVGICLIAAARYQKKYEEQRASQEASAEPIWTKTLDS